MVTFEIYGNIKTSYDRILQDPNHRYRSWEHCYKAFNQLLNNHISLDMASLNLAFYLASWGMYRGSSQLLQKDYLIHNDAISILLKDEYRILWNLDIERIKTYSYELDMIFALSDELIIEYRKKGISPTDTLITKILLGTYCCVPAYDSFFKNGIRNWNRKYNKNLDQRIIMMFGKRSLHSLVKFYFDNLAEFQRIQSYISGNSIPYPPMKLIDMYFWNLG